MDSIEAISILTSFTGQHQNETDALKIALELLNVGYTTDQERIDRSHLELKARIVLLTELLVDNNIEIPE